jgi:hypothetical protein
MDRENLDTVYGELLSGYHDDSDEAGLDLGHNLHRLFNEWQYHKDDDRLRSSNASQIPPAKPGPEFLSRSKRLSLFVIPS